MINDVKLAMVVSQAEDILYELKRIKSTVLSNEATSSILYKNQGRAADLSHKLADLWKESIR